MFEKSFKYKLIYIFEIRDDAHKGLLKIGDTTIKTDYAVESLLPNCKALEAAAWARIHQYTNLVGGVDVNLLHTELAIRNVNGNTQSFRDYAVHSVLLNSNVKKKNPRGSTGKEWFRVDLNTARAAIAAVKLGKKNLSGMRFEEENFIKEINFRPEQTEAINLTIKHFKKHNKFLWNAKMRFGKTLCALKVAKEMNFAKTIIITHRPVVNDSWFKDFREIFHGNINFIYGSKSESYSIEELLADGRNFVYFASIQDLRGSEVVGGKYDKNSAVFDTDWDFVIVDEAHEGTQTALGDKVIKNIVKPASKFLALSGTPFNLLDEFGDDVYTWDYVMEQRAKADWDKIGFGDSNPYDELPRMNIFTYNLSKVFNDKYLEDKVFNFREFFRTDGENFIHAADIKKFLNLLVKAENYPFSRADFREMFQHTLWIIPGVKEGRALSKLLQTHEVFGGFEIINVAGNGDSDDEPADALRKVRDAIDRHDFTITLSCGKLTTGVTVPEWTAVFMLAGSYSTSAANYLQTIFRVQSPCNKDGKTKQNCYVFDFAPDRTLKIIAESVAISARPGKTKDNDRKILGELLNFCPVIAVDGSSMREYKTTNLLQQLKQAWISRVVLRGFDDNNLYNDNLLKLDNIELENFVELRGYVGTSERKDKIVLNDAGLTEEKRAKGKRLPRERTEAEKELELRKKNRRIAISILRGISVRMPLLIYGADLPFDEDISIKKFAEIVDDASWAEFMPRGVTKNFFAKFIKFYDEEIFIAAGHRIRNIAKNADELIPTERVKKIAELFSTFKNPDKETVLTPWRVVNLHIDSAFDKNFFKPDKKILEINSKSGLYPLYVTYNIYRARLGDFSEDDFKDIDVLRRIWDKSVAENIFVICKTPMAQKITRRTLLGYRDAIFNAHCFDDLINLLKNDPKSFIKNVTSEKFWQKGVDNMKFDGVVGNPPYQNITSNTSDEPIYNYFIETAQKLSDKVSLIHPARFLFNAGKTPKEFNQRLLANEHFKVIKYFPKSQEVFPTSDIKGGVVITLYDANQNFEPIKLFIPFEELKSIYQKVVLGNKNFRPISEIIYPPESFHFTKKFHEDNPHIVEILSDGHDDDLTTNIFEKLPDIFLDDKPNDGREYIQILGLIKMKRAFKWIRREYIRNETNLDKYKILVPKSNGSGALGEVVSTPLVGSPLVGSTQTFITVGAFDTRAEADACIAYIKSKFCRALLGILKVTQHNPPATWAMVPLQDFTASSDIDWSKSIKEIDAQLYSKYGLDAAEIKFIEEKVKAMD